jgi:hypothetical protein
MDNVDIETALDALKIMMDTYSVRYIVVSTTYTKHHIERLMGSCRDRGTWKWIAETHHEDPLFKNDEHAAQCVKEKYTSNIDRCDLFPRLYFLKTSFINEFREWLKARNLQITDIEAPKI